MPQYSVNVQSQGLTGGTAQTIWQLRTAATRRARIREWGCSFDGVSAANTPVKIELLRQTSNGTMTTYTPLRLDMGETAAITAAATAATVEPGSGEQVGPQYFLTPNGGVMVMQYPQDQMIWIPVSSWLGFRANAAQNVNIATYVIFEE